MDVKFVDELFKDLLSGKREVFQVRGVTEDGPIFFLDVWMAGTDPVWVLVLATV